MLQKIILVIAMIGSILSLCVQGTASEQKLPSKTNNIKSDFFIENKGQWNNEVLYLARLDGLNVWITKFGIVYDHYHITRNKQSKQNNFLTENFIEDSSSIKGHVVKMSFELGGSEISEGNDKKTAYYNYFIGNDSTKWASFVSLFSEVIHKDVYPGIDARYYFDRSRGKPAIRYDFIAAPGTDISDIKLKFEGQDALRVDESGELVISTSLGDVKHGSIYAYQNSENGNRQISTKFVKNTDGTISFTAENYDKNKKLIIDPLIYSTFIGGSNGEWSFDCTIDGSGQAYITGETGSQNYPTTSGAYDSSIQAYVTVIITKLNPLGTDLIFSTLLGGNRGEKGESIKIDGSGNVYVTGTTYSYNFPTSEDAFDKTYRDTFSFKSGGPHIFVTKLNNTGSGLIFSTYVGGNGREEASEIQIDGNGNSYVSGITTSGDFPITPGAFKETMGDLIYDVFVSKLNSSGTDLIYSTFIGAGSYVVASQIDNNNNIYLTGSTYSDSLPITSGAYHKIPNDKYWEAYALKLNSTGSDLIYSTYLSKEFPIVAGTAIILDNYNNAYIAYGDYAGVPLVNDSSGVLKLNSSGSNLQFLVTNLPFQTYTHSLSLDDYNNLYITGFTYTENFPTTKYAFRSYDHFSNGEAFIIKYNISLNIIEYATLMGGIQPDEAFAIIAENEDIVYISGHTISDDYPTTPNAYDTTENNGDAFVTKIELTYFVVEGTQEGLCSGTDIEVNYETNIICGSDNVFTAQLSDMNGDFFNPINIGSIESTVSGTIQCNIPAGIKAGTNYRIRIVSSNPERISDVIEQSFEIYKDPTAKIEKEVALCPNDSVRIGNTANGQAPFTYRWEPESGLSDPTIAQPWAKPDETTKYQFSITDGKGCKNQYEITVIVVPESKSDAGDDANICVGESVKIGGEPSATGSEAPYYYSWSNPESLDDATLPNPIAFPIDTTQYILTVFDKNGCITRDTMVVNVYPKTSVDVGEDFFVCKDSKIQLNAEVTGGVKPYLFYKWEPSIGLDNPNIIDPYLQLSDAGEYQYVLTVTDYTDCVSSDTIVVDVINPPQLDENKTVIDFGLLDACSSSKQDSIILNNPNSIDITIDSINISKNFDYVKPSLPFTIKAGEEISIAIRFSTSVEGQVSGKLELFGSPCEIYKSIDLTGAKEKLLLSTDKSAIDFGKAISCEAVQIDTSIAITNTGQADAVLYFDKSEFQSPAFELLSPVSQETLQPGNSIEVQVRYKPQESGEFSETLSIPFESGTCSDTIRIDFNAASLNPEIEVAMDNINFPDLTGCENSSDTTISIKNTGDVAIQITGTSQSNNFYISPLPLDIAVGESKDIITTFSPNAEGSYTENLELQYQPCGKSIALDISGNKQGLIYSVTDTVVFDEIIFCREQTAIGQFTIEMQSSEDIDGEIKSVNITGPFETNLEPSTVLPKNSPQNFEVIFSPDNQTPSGDIFGKLEVLLSPCDITKTIYLKAIKNDVSISNSGDIDFGNVQTGSKKREVVEFTNRGSTSIIIKSGEISTQAPFSIISTNPETDATLAPGESIFVTVEYSAGTGLETGSITLNVSDPCIIKENVQLLGTGTDESINARAVIKLGNDRKNTGEHVTIPLEIISSEDLSSMLGTDFTAWVRFNKTMLAPLPPTPHGTSYGMERVIVVTGTLNNTIGTIHELQFTAALGTDSCTIMHLDSVHFESEVNIQLLNGNFCLNDICYEGGGRFINPESSTSLIVNPNPANDEIDLIYEMAEKGDIQLEIFNMLGSKIYAEVLTTNKGHIKIDINEIPAGVYIISLKSYSQQMNRLINIVK